MANVIYFNLQVLAPNSRDLQRISDRLRQPSTEHLKSVADEPSEELREAVRNLVAFEETECCDKLLTFNEEGNLGIIEGPPDEYVRPVGEFTNRTKHGGELILAHLAEVSGEFPQDVFLLEYCDDQMNYSGKRVMNSGKTAAEFHDEFQRAQTITWVLPDIFTPFRIEHELKLEVGSLWNEWLDDMAAAIQLLKSRTNGDAALEERWTNELLERRSRFSAEQFRKSVEHSDADGGDHVY